MWHATNEIPCWDCQVVRERKFVENLIASQRRELNLLGAGMEEKL